jgi:hypothetical protein
VTRTGHLTLRMSILKLLTTACDRMRIAGPLDDAACLRNDQWSRCDAMTTGNMLHVTGVHAIAATLSMRIAMPRPSSSVCPKWGHAFELAAPGLQPLASRFRKLSRIARAASGTRCQRKTRSSL